MIWIAWLTLFASGMKLASSMEIGNDVSTATSAGDDCAPLVFPLHNLMQAEGSDGDSACLNACSNAVDHYKRDYLIGDRQFADVCNMGADVCICLGAYDWEESKGAEAEGEAEGTSSCMGSMPAEFDDKMPWAGMITSIEASNTLPLFPGAMVGNVANMWKAPRSTSIAAKSGNTGRRWVCKCTMSVGFHKLRIHSSPNLGLELVSSSAFDRYSCFALDVHIRLQSNIWLKPPPDVKISRLRPGAKCAYYDDVLDTRPCIQPGPDARRFCQSIPQRPWYEQPGTGQYW
ncbi:hypothetical protein BCR37DRAFT_383701 [Protomyces lactucae-debilis]|uniref:Extracellular membrane protein CFEM domain-containing protein n=1 Tax=Protomyces lactucae-debilis TaxID=2754530 RepID=A0A1Y2EWU8_PROLT|nr:uncharacterized protein BCR37DRAFT_383701 [Protomyces lactucae-debilis]ORY76082.1 hypothetical protein BCR37DRAFT_383701 [Protomyces lactucae-debilis]